MNSFLIRSRLWLEQRGLFPRGKLAFFTVYVLGLDLLLFAIDRIVGSFRTSYTSSLIGWVVFLTLLGFVLLSILGARWLSSRVLWRLRNRLIVTYIFIGVLPLVLLTALAGLAFYLFSGQFATYVVTSKLDLHLESLRASNSVIAYELASAVDNGRETGFNQNTSRSGELAETRVTAWLNDKLLFTTPSVSNETASVSPPNRLPANFSQVVRERGRLFLSSGITLPTKKGRLTVVSSKPFDQNLLLALAKDLGQVTLYTSGFVLQQVEQSQVPSTNASKSVPVPSKSGEKITRYYLDTGAASPTFVVGEIPPPTHIFDRPVNFATSIAVMNWADGDSSRPAAISVQTRLSALYDQLFAALGAFAPAVEILLLVVTIVFAIIIAIALFVGSRISASITRAVGQLYKATTHINRGDFSHRIPVTSNDQLAALATSFNSMTESIEKLIIEQKEKQRLENEISIAQEVQEQLFPRHIVQLPSLEVHGFCRPARSVSGDYYDFLALGRERMLLAVGDVSGKGISAALLMATIHSAVRAYSVEGIPALRQVQAVGAGPVLVSEVESILQGAEVSPGTLLCLLNHQLYHSTPQEKYATLFLAMYEAGDRRLNFSNAGHLPPLVLSESGNFRRLEDGGTVVGLFDGINYDENFVQLHPGDIFLAYSDGVTEPENDFGEFGEQRLIDLVQENRDLPLARISEIVTAAVDDWIGGKEQPDDVTLVLARSR
ncbi:MAG TPA: SpoIIE family protein phosphatase [Terriglobales bacterium]|nr:SpoIIE family protein phosphatase [Terriglobales bacterium]